MNVNTIERVVGQKVMCNGYAGTISKICDWSPSMVEVRLARGVVCVGMSELRPADATDEDLHTCGECRPDCPICRGINTK